MHYKDNESNYRNVFVSGSMLERSTFAKILTKGNPEKRLDFFRCHKRQIHESLLSFIQAEPPTLYREYILKDPEGQERVCVYLDSFEAALAGKVETFLEDQKSIGYIRAMEGYHLNDVYGFTVAFKDALWRTSIEYNDSKIEPADCLNNDDIFALNKLLDSSYYLLSLSFLETRDEVIVRHRTQLQELQRFAVGIVSIFEEEKIWAQTTQGVFDVFGLNGTFILTDQDNLAKDKYEIGRMIGLQVPQRDMEKILKSVHSTYTPLGLDKNSEVQEFSSAIDTDQFRFVSSPIMNRKSQLTGILCLHDQGRMFRFSKFDRTLLYQFAYFTAAVSANCRMVSEIAEKRQDLRDLTTKLISVQEEERKKIAADIHDVLTQALTGIGYKALYCMEIVGKDHDRLYQELELLTDTINDALRQSRQIIRNLRPHILDDIGIIAAFRKHVNDFSKKFGIQVHFTHPDTLTVNPDQGIALFRILQEAMHNIQRHADATQVALSLLIGENGRLIMTVQDNGSGFNLKKRDQQRQRGGLGLITMRERAEDQGGTFSVESRSDNGCTIRVVLPLKEVEDA